MEIKLCYACGYDGKKCEKAVVNVSKGVLLQPTNEKIKERLSGRIEKGGLDCAWDICDGCERNYSLSAGTHGNLAFDYGDWARRI
jgi:hypothetical protein